MENNITNKHILINNMKTLVDLNGDDVNFDIDFKVTSKNKEPYIISVVDQKTLDNQEDLEYKEVDDGIISGNVKNTKNVYQNYFLCLKSISESEIECDIEIIRNTPPLLDNKNVRFQDDIEINETQSYNNNNYYNCIFQWKWYIFYFIIFFIFLYFLFYTTNVKNVLNTNNSSDNIISSNVGSNTANFNFECELPKVLQSPPVDTEGIARQFKFLYDSK